MLNSISIELGRMLNNLVYFSERVKSEITLPPIMQVDAILKGLFHLLVCQVLMLSLL